MSAQESIVAVLRSQDFTTATVRGTDFHGVYYTVTAGEAMPVVLYLPQTGYHISQSALDFLRSSGLHPVARHICEALLAQDCEPVDIIPTLAL